MAFRTPYVHSANLTPWWETAGDYTIDVLAEFSPVGIGIAIIALLVTLPLNLIGELLMSLYQAMVNRYVAPVIESTEPKAELRDGPKGTHCGGNGCNVARMPNRKGSRLTNRRPA